ncbi:MAG: hypothetical protein RL311_149 [Bacteroidota bacterium]|jgi:hypothetical protein
MNEQLKILYDWVGTEPTQLTRQIVKDKIIEIDRSIKPTKARSIFTPPTVQEILDYSSLNNLNIDAEHFYDHFESNGWLISGRSKMKNWEAAVRNWSRNPLNNTKQNRHEKQQFANPTKTAYEFSVDRVIETYASHS